MSAEPSQVTVARATSDCRDIAEFQALMSRRYVDHCPRVVGNPHDFRFRSRSAAAAGLSVEQARYRAVVAAATEPFETVLVVSVLAGQFDVVAGRQSARAGSGDSLLLPPGLDLSIVMDRLGLRAAQIPVEAVGRVAGRSGVDPPDFRFDAMTPVSPAANRLWTATAGYLTDVLAAPGIAPMMLTAAIEAAATAAVTVFPNTTMTLSYVAGAGRVAPAAVRRAVAYLEANAAEPITVDDIAAAAGLGVRALQTGFRRHLDVTPLGYLRRHRLELAHRDLQAADASGGDTVADIAFRWGFPNLGRFAGYYRAAFGRPPSQTLRT
ncbi:AraC family transcriptional regulator [Actinoplanes sp. TRM 88003]|uniref:AraC family transcriptional regulator n=1 Tax=Paractinoplanes aksuensis TaxID=2939490 RepID=A0ABT1DWC2_9ACTN|nr:helix-turn-helix transcriptional regulator [Actinoplanes aksuensis]MCO8275157.1 AraC family transcriptional regulator [Actinoplanes aksuensis]